MVLPCFAPPQMSLYTRKGQLCRSSLKSTGFWCLVCYGDTVQYHQTAHMLRAVRQYGLELMNQVTLILGKYFQVLNGDQKFSVHNLLFRTLLNKCTVQCSYNFCLMNWLSQITCYTLLEAKQVRIQALQLQKLDILNSFFHMKTQQLRSDEPHQLAVPLGEKKAVGNILQSCIPCFVNYIYIPVIC